MAINAETGREFRRSGRIDRYTGCTMALKGDKLVYQSAHGVFCLDARSGKKEWAVEKEIPYGVGNMPNSLVLSADAVYCEEGNNIHAYSLADGSDPFLLSTKRERVPARHRLYLVSRMSSKSILPAPPAAGLFLVPKPIVIVLTPARFTP